MDTLREEIKNLKSMRIKKNPNKKLEDAIVNLQKAIIEIKRKRLRFEKLEKNKN